MGRFKVLIFLFLLNIWALLSAQKPNFSFEHITTENGLLHNHVNCLLQDYEGYMWIGAQDGVQMYNGRSFRLFQDSISSSVSFLSNQANCLYESRDSTLWIGAEKGLYKFDRDHYRFKRYSSNTNDITSLSNNDVRSIVEDKEGMLWIATYGGGLNKFNSKTGNFEHFIASPNNQSGLSGNFINTLFIDKDDRLWIGTEGNGACWLNAKTGIFKKLDQIQVGKEPKFGSNITISSIQQDKNGLLWFGTWDNGLISFNERTGVYKHYKEDQTNPYALQDQTVRQLYIDKEQRLWAVTFSDGLALYDYINDRFYNYKNNSSDPTTISNGKWWTITEDREGILWLGGFGNGISQINKHKHKFTVIRSSYSDNKILPGNLVSNILQTDGQKLLLATENGLCLYDKSTNKSEFLLSSKEKDIRDSRSIVKDKYGYYWVGVSKGLIRLNKNLKDYQQITQGNTIFSVTADLQGNIWAGGWGAGLFQISEKNLTESKIDTSKIVYYKNNPNNNQSIASDVIWSIYPDTKNNLWIGSRNGIERYDIANETFHKITFDNKVYSCGSFCEDKDGNIWMANFTLGLIKYSPETNQHKVFNLNTGSIKRNSFSVIVDNSNNIWTMSDKGLTFIDTKTENIKSYSTLDGLPSNTSVMGAVSKLRSGELAFGTLNGLFVFNPTTFTTNTIVPEVVITDIKLFGSSIEKQDSLPVEKVKKIKFLYHQNMITFEFATLSFSATERNQFKYKMEGFDNEWINSYYETKATYTNLNPGTYVFKVIGSNSDGCWNTKGTSIEVIITPPWWLTWWAYVLYLMICLLIVVAYRRFLKSKYKLENELKIKEAEARAIKTIEEEKHNFFINISHEFKTPLSLILGPAESLLDGKLDKDQQIQVSIISRNANNLLQLINQLLDFRKVETNSFKLQVSLINAIETIEIIKANFNELAVNKNINYRLKTSTQVLDSWIDTDILQKALNNLLSNAFKFTLAGGNIEIEIATMQSIKGEMLSVKVKDSGVGIPEEHINRLFKRFYQVNHTKQLNKGGTGIGLALTKELIELHKGEILITSDIGIGSTFEILLPIEKEQYTASEIIGNISNEVAYKPFGASNKVAKEITKEYTQEYPQETVNSILIVEDNPDLRAFLALELSRYYKIHEACNGKEGLLKAQEILPTLIISDVMMPEMDGFEFCEKIKTDENTSHIPVILLTALSSPENIIHGLETGADSYLTKPFNGKVLLATINNLIELRNRLKLNYLKNPDINIVEVTENAQEKKFINQLHDIIEKHLSNEDLNPDKIAEEMFISESQLYKKTREITGHSVGDTIKIVRMKNAARLLKEGYRTSEVCYMTGFKTQPHFTRVFIQYFGIAPSKYCL